MPEEINRLVTDAISDLYFTTTKSAGEILLKYGVPEKSIFFVGNTMIDTLNYEINNLRPPSFWDELELDKQHYYLLTLHRPSNVNDKEILKKLLDAIHESAQNALVIFPVHPRTKKTFQLIEAEYTNIKMVDPQGYLEFIFLLKNAIGVITDSGGITEEATVLNIPCVTLRQNTERPETVLEGTNELIGDHLDKLKTCMEVMYMGAWKKGKIPENWDGNAAVRIIDILLMRFKTKPVHVLEG
jgi:UDP-N-acetylglucosamine 2-epimerase (non-hydrolysing)